MRLLRETEPEPEAAVTAEKAVLIATELMQLTRSLQMLVKSQHELLMESYSENAALRELLANITKVLRGGDDDDASLVADEGDSRGPS
jgi:hypothetical protein